MIHMQHISHKPLHLDILLPEPRLARQLPPDVAFKYRAFPIAQAGNHITIAMADPEDDEACQQIQEILGQGICCVHADACQITQILTELWPQYAVNSNAILVCGPEDKIQASQSYLRNWAEMLSMGTLECHALENLALINQVLTELPTQEHGLVIVLLPEVDHIERMLQGTFPKAILKRSQAAHLLVRQQQWPLRRIMLIPPLTRAGDGLTRWVVRLASFADSEVLVLAITPPVPGMYQGLESMRGDLTELMRAESAYGRQLRQTAALLDKNEIHATIRLRQGDAHWQILQELQSCDYDLVVIASQPQDYLEKQREGGLCRGLLRSCDCPVLIVPCEATDSLDGWQHQEHKTNAG